MLLTLEIGIITHVREIKTFAFKEKVKMRYSNNNNQLFNHILKKYVIL